MPRLTCQPFAMLKPDGKAEPLALVERVTRALINDSNVTLSVTSTGVVVLTGGCLDNEQAACDQETGHDAYAVHVLRIARSMMLSVRHMLKVSRCCTREKLLQTRRALTQYAATPVVVIGPGTKQRSSAFGRAHSPAWMALDRMHARCGERLPLGRTYSLRFRPVGPVLKACRRIGPHGGRWPAPMIAHGCAGWTRQLD